MTNRTFEALGKSGAEFSGLETFEVPKGLETVVMDSAEVTAKCPITGQPDFYHIYINYKPSECCIESKSMKLYLGELRDKGAFGEDLAVTILNDVVNKIQPRKAKVTVIQVPRGGVGIYSQAKYRAPK
jgi:7-cyano-7-deazaguanine reductase